jgi:nucleotide-binding universal stress UspA family protein
MSQTKVIVSYDGTNNEDDAIALGSVFAAAGAEIHLGYVRHSEELVDDQEANALLARGTALFERPLGGAHTVTDRSTPEGLRALAEREGADVIVFCSDSHTAKGAVSVGNSAQRLLDGGRFAIAIAPAGLAERADTSISQIAATEDPADQSAQQTALALAKALHASVLSAGEPGSDLLVVGSRPEAGTGQVALSAAALKLIENASAAVLVVPRSVSVSFDSVEALTV